MMSSESLKKRRGGDGGGEGGLSLCGGGVDGRGDEGGEGGDGGTYSSSCKLNWVINRFQCIESKAWKPHVCNEPKGSTESGNTN